jgi:mitochondrial pyruvate carrier 2
MSCKFTCGRAASFMRANKTNSLATVNAFLFCVGATQVTRIMMYNQSVKGKSPVEEIKDAASEQAAVVEGLAKDAKKEVQKAL